MTKRPTTKPFALKLAEFLQENYHETPDASTEAELLGALAYQAGGIIAHLGGPIAPPEELTEVVLTDFLALVRAGIMDARIVMKGGDINHAGDSVH